MPIMAIISDTCCFISNIEIRILISQLMLVSINVSTVLAVGQNYDKFGRCFSKGCYIKPIFCQGSLVTLKIIK